MQLDKKTKQKTSIFEELYFSKHSNTLEALKGFKIILQVLKKGSPIALDDGIFVIIFSQTYNPCNTNASCKIL